MTVQNQGVMLATYIPVPTNILTGSLATDVLFPIDYYFGAGVSTPLVFNSNGNVVTFPNNQTTHAFALNQVFAIQFATSAVAIRPVHVDNCLGQSNNLQLKSDLAFWQGVGRLAVYHYSGSPANLTQCIPRAAFLIAAADLSSTSFQSLIDSVSGASISDAQSGKSWNISASITLPGASSPTVLSVARALKGHTIYSRTVNGNNVFDPTTDPYLVNGVGYTTTLIGPAAIQAALNPSSSSWTLHTAIDVLRAALNNLF